ncbi:phage portal protein [Frankia sp. Cr1]|uniref:phage portal protein n=1 Tax=Frankia sp. Cr1 TaxID=3073931 RepID=UPI002AD3A582|nr:phage portal protein [Frankia sp. Cr1]
MWNGVNLDVWESWAPTRPDGIEENGRTFQAYVSAGYAANGVVFAVILARMLLFSEAVFKYQRFNQGRPGDLFGDQSLAVLETPWPGGTTGDLLARMEQHASLGGNAFVVRPRGAQSVRIVRPDWMDILLGSNVDPETPGDQYDARVIGYVYHPGGRGRGTADGDLFLADEVAHYAPIPDPIAHARGMSWLTPVVQEITADGLMTRHKGKFFEHAATPNMLLKTDRVLNDKQRTRLLGALKARNEGIENAYKTLLLEGGVDATIVGHSFEQISFATTQAAGENRIAVAAGVPGIVAGLKEGLSAATYSNYAQAKRRFGDMTMRPLWRNVAGSLSVIVPPPKGARLWYDDRDIPALREDAKDAAEIHGMNATTVATLVSAGFTPESAVAAVTNGDLNLLRYGGAVSGQPALSPAATP